MGTSGLCPICFAATEDNHHLFRSCSLASDAWLLSPLGNFPHLNAHNSIWDWLIAWFTYLRNHDMVWMDNVFSNSSLFYGVYGALEMSKYLNPASLQGIQQALITGMQAHQTFIHDPPFPPRCKSCKYRLNYQRHAWCSYSNRGSWDHTIRQHCLSWFSPFLS